MTRIIQKLAIICALFVLYGCTVANYQLRDELQESTERSTCDIAFTLELESAAYTNTFGANPHEVEALNPLKSSYIDSTKEAMSELGCNSIHTEDAASANFTINVKRQIQLSALPQEWLTGLSLGLIPSWGTRYDQFVYTFENKVSKKSFSYEVDQNSYNHLVLFPVFWVTFFTADEQKIYKSAITNFVKSA